jgi:protein phosphatase
VTRFACGSVSDLGRVRAVNQDAALIADDLFVVADGMGGHRGGEVASEIAVTVLGNEVVEPTIDALVAAVISANRKINNRSRDEAELSGMGTTVTAMALVSDDEGERLGVVNVGDSRTYIVDDEELVQLTDDHSLVGEMLRSGQLTKEEALDHPQRNILTRALGVDSEVEVDWYEIQVRQGDRFLLCTDGLFNEVTEDQIASVLRRLADPEEAAQELVRQAVEHGGRDNITVVIVDVEEGPGDDARGVVGSRITRRSGVEPDPAGFTSAAALDDAAGDAAMDGEPDTAADSVAHDGADEGEGTDTESEPELAQLASGRPLIPPEPSVRKTRRARFTWRVLAMIVALALIVGIAALALSVFSGGSYFVGFDDNEVAIFRGRPGGVLWIEPSLEESTGLCRSEVGASWLTPIEEGIEYGTVEEAQELVDTISRQAAEAGRLTDDPCEGVDAASVGSDTTVPPTSAPVIAPTTALSDASDDTTP